MEKYLPEGAVFNSRETEKIFASEGLLKEACEKRLYLEARALMCDNAHNLHFKLGNIKGFMPHDECAEGVKDATVNFMMLKMNVEFDENADIKSVMKDVLKNCKRVEDDCEIYI